MSIPRIECRIVKRGLELLEVGGRVVYSTCSLNPVEDEAVVARILQETEGTVVLSEADEYLPGLKFARGLHKWKVSSKEMDFYSRWVHGRGGTSQDFSDSSHSSRVSVLAQDLRVKAKTGDGRLILLLI